MESQPGNVLNLAGIQIWMDFQVISDECSLSSCQVWGQCRSLYVPSICNKLFSLPFLPRGDNAFELLSWAAFTAVSFVALFLPLTALTFVPLCVTVSILFSCLLLSSQRSHFPLQPLLPLLLLFLHGESQEEISWASTLPHCTFVLQPCHLPCCQHSASPSAGHCAYVHLNFAAFRGIPQTLPLSAFSSLSLQDPVVPLEWSNTKWISSPRYRCSSFLLCALNLP